MELTRASLVLATDPSATTWNGSPTRPSNLSTKHLGVTTLFSCTSIPPFPTGRWTSRKPSRNIRAGTSRIPTTTGTARIPGSRECRRTRGVSTTAKRSSVEPGRSTTSEKYGSTIPSVRCCTHWKTTGSWKTPSSSFRRTTGWTPRDPCTREGSGSPSSSTIPTGSRPGRPSTGSSGPWTSPRRCSSSPGSPRRTSWTENRGRTRFATRARKRTGSSAGACSSRCNRIVPSGAVATSSSTSTIRTGPRPSPGVAREGSTTPPTGSSSTCATGAATISPTTETIGNESERPTEART
mmetsp:Transcript_1020/g.2555  ORF Transcript_1020/g.2555 Transcript_1020/m.2555 type:complete len:295 (-) Transcript_1020:162-1046(-)